MKYWLLLFCNFFTLCLFAEEVPLPAARNWALNFFQNQTGSRSNSIQLDMVWNGEDTNSRSNTQPAFYIFNRTDQKGFVIVSGDDLVNPLIGYSFDHEFQVKDMPSHIYSWLMNRKAEVNYIRKNKHEALKGMNSYWTSMTPSTGNVLKKIETALWNQGAPYNNKCPIDMMGRRSVTGCVATAFAIALKAREWPDAGMGVAPSYKYTDGQGTEVVIPEHPLGHPYEWNKMPLKNLTPSSDKEAIEQVSTLMVDCGKLAQAMYSSRETGAFSYNVAKALREHLKYSPNLDYETREYYSTTTWNAMLQKELNENGPVIYGGNSKGGGHAFILDGYTDKDYYSVNWGWGGVANGYFTLSLLDPDNQGIGGSNTNDGYNTMQDAILFMKKATSGEILTKYPNYHLINYKYDDYKKYFYGLVPATNQIEKGVPFKIESVSFQNLAFKGNPPLEINISLYNQNQEFKESVSETIAIDDLDELYIQFVSTIDCKISSTIEEGDYLAVGYRPKGCKEWKEMRGGHQTQSRIPLLGNNFASAQDVIVLSSGDKYDDVHWGIQASRKVIKKNEEFFIKTGLVSNTTFEPFNGKISAALFGKDGTLKYRVTENSTTILPALHAGECKEYTIQSCKVTKDIEEGDYIALCYQAQNSDTWNRIPPLTRVTGRIPLQAQDKEPILEEETSFHFDKMKKQITLTTLENTSFDWQNAKGSSIKTGKAANGIISIDAAGLSKGNYKLILENGTQSKTIQIIL